MENFLTAVLVSAVALIDARGRVLMQKRAEGSAHAGLWEFPGGKVETGELARDAVVREIDEELGVALDACDLEPLTFASGREGVGEVVILLYTCRHWQGTPQCRDAEELCWCSAGELASLAKPPLDDPLSEAVTRLLEARSA